ncbi:MAG: hypothetical protein IPM54_45040 [Polyangiaceae bacterium]|nr:hypothetical protein [Polyangiaceae bacterium]
MMMLGAPRDARAQPSEEPEIAAPSEERCTERGERKAIVRRRVAPPR